MPVAERTFEEIALDDPDVRWELHGGMLREKPGVSEEYSRLYSELAYVLRRQLDPADYVVKTNGPHLRTLDGSHYIPDVVVITASVARAKRGRVGRLETYETPLPLVVEIWSPSTGDRDMADKIPGYRARGDQEIWRLHPYDESLRIWRREPDGSYREEERSSGVVEILSLPGVRIDLDALFAMLTD